MDNASSLSEADHGQGLEPLQPESLTWIHAGDFRMILLSARAGLLQLMHPAIGAAVMQHSKFVSAPWERLARSLAPVMTAIYGGPSAVAAARDIRDYHRKIGGVDERGRAYHALQPEAFFWGHATIFDNVVQTADLFAHPLTLEEKRRFYDESRCWYRLYGVNDRAMPKDWEAFSAYFEDVCARVLEPTPAARHLLDRIHGRVPTILPWIPRIVSRGITPPAFKLLWFVTLGTLPDAVRRSLGYSWDSHNDEALERIKHVVRRAWPRLPRRIRYLPIAYRAIRAAERARSRRSGGRAAAG